MSGRTRPYIDENYTEMMQRLRESLPPEESREQQIQRWRQSSDPSLRLLNFFGENINIGDSVNFLRFTTSKGLEISGELTLLSGSNLNVMGGGGITIRGGGDIELIGSATDPGTIIFKGTSYTVSLGMFSPVGENILLSPDTDNVVDIAVGSSSLRFEDIVVHVKGNLQLFSTEASDIWGYIYAFSNASRGEAFIQSRFDDLDTAEVRVVSDVDGDRVEIIGVVNLVGTAKVVKDFLLNLVGTGGGVSSPTFDNDFSPFDGYNMTVGDDLHYVFEVPTDCDTSEPIGIHIHWFIDRAYASENAEVNFQAVYRVVTEGGTEPVDSGGQTATITSGDVNIPATAKALVETPLADITAFDLNAHDVIGFDFSRIAIVDGNNPGGAPAKNPIIVDMEISYIVNKLGVAI